MGAPRGIDCLFAPARRGQELARHNTVASVWVAIHGKAYDVTAFLAEHPGGDEVLMEVAGTDATESFEEAGHPDDAFEVRIPSARCAPCCARLLARVREL